MIPITSITTGILLLLLIALLALMLMLWWQLPRILSRILEPIERMVSKFESFDRSTPQDRYFRFRYSYVLERTPLLEIILAAERSNDIRLSWGAREMLIIPVVEIIEKDGSVDWRQVDKSIQSLIETIANDKHMDMPYRYSGTINSLNVIRAFFQRFCNIPPFCRPDEDSTR